METTFPPKNFTETESKIDGIEIFKPVPKKEELAVDVSFKCPQCGATTAYNVEDGGLRCSFCGYYDAQKAPVVGKGAEEFEFKVETLERLTQGWGEVRDEISCQNCGAVVTIPPKTLSVTCPFCGSNKVLQKQASQSDLRPKFVVPFKLNNPDCRKIAQTWLGSSWMTPSQLKSKAFLQDFIPIYLPYWTFDSTGAADWKAEVGHEVTEQYYDKGEWKTRTRTDWRWESGHAEVLFDDLLIPATSSLSRLHLLSIQNYNLTELVNYEPKFLAGLHAKSYDIQLEESWEVARQEMREAVKESCISQASTPRIRNLSMALDFSKESWRYILLPAYISVYQFQNLPFQVMINGQSGAISGQRPVDWQKVWLVIGLCLLPGVFFGLIGLVTLLLGGIGAFIGGLGFFLLIIGVILSFVIFQKAQSMDDI